MATKSQQMPAWSKWIASLLLGGVGLTLTFNLIVNMCSNNHTTINICNCPDKWKETICDGEDSLGRKAKFALAVLTQEEKWVYNSDTTLEKSGKFRKSFPEYLKSLPYLKQNKGFICVGTASKDGSDSSQNGLAAQRADEIVFCVRPLSDPTQDVYRLNLGRYSTLDKDVPNQRRVIVIGILEKEDGMDDNSIKEACYNALKNELKASVKLNLENYQSFDFQNIKNLK
jgi:hypothetical protein